MSYNHLTMDERNVIYRMQWQGYSNAEIARGLCWFVRHRPDTSSTGMKARPSSTLSSKTKTP